MLKNWFIQGLVTNVVWAVLALAGGAVLTYLAKTGSAWTDPLLFGLTGFALISVGALTLKGITRLPRKRIIPNVGNIESTVHVWLDNFRTTVKNDPVPETYFRFAVTMDGGTTILVGRARGVLSDYLLLRSDITLTPKEQNLVDAMPPEDTTRLLLQARLQMGHARVGYTGLALPLRTMTVHKRIPINDLLTEDLFIARLEEVEAGVHVLAAVLLLGMYHHDPNFVMQIAQRVP